MNSQSIPRAKRVIRALNASDAQTLVQNALKMKTAGAVFEVIQSTYGDIITELEYS
jgi:phosphoenolpyruvate-protein kinase (PTS system EI component)